MRLWWTLVLACGCSRAPAPVPPAPPPSVGRLDDEPLYQNGDLLTIADGGAVMARGGAGWEPLPGPGRRIELRDGSYWLSLGFATDETGPHARWIPPSHPRTEIADRLRELEAEAQNLPPALYERVKPELELMALVSTLEGRFADPATRPDDTAASLGIFQWATPRKDIHSAGSTLSKFFITLSRRAASDPFYAEAWKQCQTLGLTFSSGDLVIKKKRLNGAQLEAKLGPEMGRGALRSYQLIAALDWIEEVKSTVVRPGLRSAPLIGHDYAEAERGRLITLRMDGHTLELRPSVSARLADFFHAPAALATAVSLGVNRPRYVEAALWQALNPLPTHDRVDALLAQLRGPADVERWRVADLESQPAYAELQRILWPSPSGADEIALEREFTERALALYRPQERERRARRLVTGR